MEFGALFKELGVWGGAVLTGSIVFTEVVKRAARKAKASVPWYTWIVMPSILAFVGVLGMVVGGIIVPQMALLVWFVVSFAGPALYRFIIEPKLRKAGLK